MSLAHTIQKELLSLKSIVITLSLAFFYAVFALLLLNYRLLYQTFIGNFPAVYKIKLFIILISGAWTSMNHFDFFLFVINALLVAINLLLIGKTISAFEHSEKVHVTFGGATLIGLATTGCTSCGFSLLSILGLSSSVSFLPFHGLELHIIAIALLLVSFFYMINQLHKAKYCTLYKKASDKNEKRY